MAAIDLFHAPTFLSRIVSVFARAEPAGRPVRDTDGARRNFILEMMDVAPEAFASEEGVRCAMYYFSGRL